MKRERRMLMINFAELFELDFQLSNNQKKLDIVSALDVFYGVSLDGYKRLSFLSKSKAPKLESTKFLRVSQGEESQSVYWTCLDLLQSDATSVFYAFCENIVSSIISIADETTALDILKKRFITWKTMFKQVLVQDVTRDVIQGLFGELYFLKNVMLEKYSPKETVGAWSGSDLKSKDYAIGKEWYEIKTVGANTSKVHISSLAQLSSIYPGHLVVIKVEAMSEEFVAEDDSINSLMKNILGKLNDEILEEQFLTKIHSVVGEMSNRVLNAKFSVKSVNSYLVDNAFPRLIESSIPYSEIEDIEYSLNIHAIEKYKEKKL